MMFCRGLSARCKVVGKIEMIDFLLILSYKTVVFFCNYVKIQNYRVPLQPKFRKYSFSGCSAVRLAHLLWEQGVAGSNPATPTKRKEELFFR